MEKVAIPYHLGYISPVFDVARNFLVVSTRDGGQKGREKVVIETIDPFLRAQGLKNHGVHVVVCGAISQPYETALSARGIKVIGAICGPLEEVLWAFLDGTFDDPRFLMPGFGHLRFLRGRHGREHRR